jgi:magnesium transporter
MINRYTYEDITWVDLTNPSQDEVRHILDEFKIDPMTAQELLVPSVRPHVDSFDGYLYLVLHFPALRRTTASTFDIEIDFLIGNKWIITTRYDAADPLHAFSKIFEANTVASRERMSEHAGFVFYYMMIELYAQIDGMLDDIRDRLEDAEERIYSGLEREMVVELSTVGRDLLNFKQALFSHKDVLQSFVESSPELYGKDYRRHAQTLLAEYYRLNAQIKAHDASLRELRDTNLALVSTKQNEVMKLFTILAFVTFPLTLFTSLFGMNTKVTPLVSNENGFWMIVGIMTVITILFFLYFKHKEWL